MIDTLIDNYDDFLSKKLNMGIISQKTCTEYRYVLERLRSYLFLLNLQEEQECFKEIKGWNNSGKNKASTKTVKRQIILVHNHVAI